MPPDVAAALGRLEQDMEGLRDDVRDELLAIIAAALVLISIGRQAAALRQIEAAADRAARAYRLAYLAGADLQRLAVGVPPTGAALAARVQGYFNIALSRARDVLTPQRAADYRRGKLFYRAYAATMANAGVSRGVRAGMQDTAVAAGATRKMFVRTAPVAEPRDHSSLESQVKAVNDPWIIAGVAVQAPGDDALPLSERINCKHANLYLP